MHVHSCTPSVSMHIETVSLTQTIIHPLSLLGWKKCPSQAEKDTAYSQLKVHGSSQSCTSCALEQGGKHVRAKTASILIKADFSCVKTATESIPPESYAAGHMDRACGASSHGVTREQNCSMGVQSSCHCWYLRHWSRQARPMNSHEEIWDCMVISSGGLEPLRWHGPQMGRTSAHDDHSRWGGGSSISTAKDRWSICHKADILACHDVESVKRNHFKSQFTNKKGKDECVSSTHRPTSSPLGPTLEGIKKKKKNPFPTH